jgi:hypothetical protein
MSSKSMLVIINLKGNDERRLYPPFNFDALYLQADVIAYVKRVQ